MRRRKLKAKPVHPFDVRTYHGRDGTTYLVFKSPGTRGYFHVFAEVEAKQAALNCGGRLPKDAHTQAHWRALWDNAQSTGRSGQ
jgi:hypothetical protein